MTLSINLNRQDDFNDITEPFEYIYPEKEVIGGVVYKHMSGGVYLPEQKVSLNKKECKKLVNKYWDLVFYAKDPEEYSNQYGMRRACDQKCFDICFAYSEKMVTCDPLVTYMKTQSEKDISRDIESSDEPKMCWFPQNSERKKKTLESGLCHFRPVDKNDRYQGYPKHIQINSWIGYLIEPGIYFFPVRIMDEYSSDSLTLCTYDSFSKEVAAIAYPMGYRISFEMAIEYMACGKENFARLKEIQETMKGSFYHEFPVKNEEDKESQPRVLDIEKILKGSMIEKWEKPEYIIEQDAKEIFAGIGFANIILDYKYIFCEQKEMKKYDFAYLLGDKLILVVYKNEGWEREECDIRLLEELTLQKMQELKGGFSMNRYIRIIDCKEEKEKEVLKTDVYELWKAVKEK